ncbi:MAG: hypothetical protein F4Y45_13255 [Acidobacteria bacterium]|nr:hypothetical protein [Acidobacteriota bacterium]MYD70294.1 hypothetical protein [Acidobacteriota bacterium]MYJ04688.1 hypothetical protein [Acidobacteriota bacterium]
MEAVLDIVAGTGVILFLLGLAFIERARWRLLAVVTVAAIAYAAHPVAVRQSLSAFIGGLDGVDVQTLAALLALDGVLGCAGATLLLRARHGPHVHRLRRLAAHHVGVIPVLALFYLEMKAFHAASQWSFSTTALALCLAVVVAGLTGSEAIRRLLPDRNLRAELRLLVHVGQVVLAAGLTAFALRGGVESNTQALEAGPHAAVAGAVAVGILLGYWSHRRRLGRIAA